MQEVSNERMALFYNESSSEKDKQEIFLEIKNRMMNKITRKIVSFFVKYFSFQNEKTFDFEEYYQIADEVLLSVIHDEQCGNKNYNLEAWYIIKLKQELINIQRLKQKKSRMDNLTDFERSSAPSLENIKNIELALDENYLKDIIKLYGNKIKFRTKKQKIMFMLSLGFTKSKKSYSYERIAKRFNCTRQNVMQTCKRTLGSIKRMLEKDSKLEELRQFL